MSCGDAPRDRSFAGFSNPWRIGPYASASPSLCVILYAIFPASKFGKIITFAFPATFEAGAFLLPTTESIAASNCSSPSISKSGRSSFNFLSAPTVFSIFLWFALPLVEKDSNATLGSDFKRALQV